jgi:hypothetical protein
MFRNVQCLVFTVMLSGFALAHEGFTTVMNDVSVMPYTITVLEDTHLTDGQSQINLMIQVAHGREAAPADTTVWLKLEHGNTLVYDNEVKYVGPSSSDGRTFYAYYIVNIPIAELGMHQAQLTLGGSSGNAKTGFQFEAKATPEFRGVELIPSLFIISICLTGLILFFVSARAPLQKNTVTQNDPKGLHHA